jgi:hypothetical protein
LQQKKLTQILNKINLKVLLKNKRIYFLIILLNSFIFTFYYGYRGILPIDSFLIFDAGYKVLNNIHPFKDYWSITGPFLDYIQSTLFLIFKVSWFSYVLHAALINFLLASVSFYLFLNIGLKFFHSLLYSLSISILAYPSIGTPFMDHHAAIFALISISFLILAFIKNKKKFWYLSSLFLVFSFFSKQIPSVYLGAFVIVIILFHVFFTQEKKMKNYFFYLLGGVTGVLFFFLIFLVNKISIYNFLTQYIYYPITIGETRNSNLNFSFKNIFLQFKFIYISLLPCVVASFFLIKEKNKKKESKVDILVLILFLGSVLIFIYSQLLTKNQILIFFLVPFCLAISHFYVLKYFNKKILINFIILILIITTFKYHLRFNEHKKFMELANADFKKAIDASILDKKLSGLQWISPRYIENPALELQLLKEVKKIIIKDNNNKIIISDYQILPALTENLNYTPNKWVDSLSVPAKNNKYFKQYKSFFISKLKEQKIVNIYIVGGPKKLDLLLLVFEKKECIEYKNINALSLKLDISSCF